MIRKIFFLLFGFLWSLTGEVMATTHCAFQGKIAITKINGQPISSPEILLGRIDVAEVQGTVEGLDQKASTCLVHVVVQRLYDGNTRVVGTGELKAANERSSDKAWFWVVHNVRFQMPDLGKGFDISAVLVSREPGELPTGVVDWGTIRRRAIAVSNPVRGAVRHGRSDKPLVGPCYVEISGIKDIYGSHVPIVPGSERPIEVDLAPIIWGELDKPAGAHEYAVVQAISDERKWVMLRKGGVSARKWTETLYLGREGLDIGELFRVRGIISLKPIRHSAYSPDGWRRLQAHICAESPEVLLRRRIGPGDLVIWKVDNQEVRGKDTLRVAPESQVEGGVEDPKSEHAIRRGETVWVLFRAAGSQGWVVGGLAIPSKDRLSWRVPALLFPKLGRYHMIAVAATQTRLQLGKSLSEDSWYKLANEHLLRRLSRMVVVDVVSVTSSPLGGAKAHSAG